MLIRNYGLFWERKYIDFGGGRNHLGHLKGYVSRRKKADFREQMGVYVLYDKDLTPVYVGQAGKGNNKLLKRLNTHTTDHLWNRWEHFSWFGVRRVNQNGSLSAFDDGDTTFKITGSKLLNQIEGVLITATEPKLNKQGARWGKDVQEYYQEIDEGKDEVLFENIEWRHKELLNEIRSLKPPKKKGKK